LTVTIDEWATCTNLKAILMNAGATFYQGSFKPFTPLEIRWFLALYILQGLSPSPQIKMKFLPQSVDRINGNDMCCHVFGPNAAKRHKEFKAFFTVQDPRKKVPPRVMHPNFKIDPFLRWIQSESMEAFDLGRFISIDEQMIGFKGNHALNAMQFAVTVTLTVFLCAICQRQKVIWIKAFHHFMLAAYFCSTNSRRSITCVEWTTCTPPQSSFVKPM
jgi:hypothetical protein